MAMAFWPSTDYDRVVDLLELVTANITAPSTGWDGIYDPGTSFTPPAATNDPANPAMFATWGYETHEPVATQDPDTAGTRFLGLVIAAWIEKSQEAGVNSGLLRTLGAEIFRELQDQSVTGLTMIPSSMRWTEPPGVPDPEWSSAQMNFQMQST
jgi:hypothetical protein